MDELSFRKEIARITKNSLKDVTLYSTFDDIGADSVNKLDIIRMTEIEGNFTISCKKHKMIVTLGELYNIYKEQVPVKKVKKKKGVCQFDSVYNREYLPEFELIRLAKVFRDRRLLEVAMCCYNTPKVFNAIIMNVRENGNDYSHEICNVICRHNKSSLQNKRDASMILQGRRERKREKPTHKSLRNILK